jgi:hypothetical protein
VCCGTNGRFGQKNPPKVQKLAEVSKKKETFILGERFRNFLYFYAICTTSSRAIASVE